MRNIQMLHTYLPHLHSLTFENTVSRHSFLDDSDSYQQKMADYNLRQNTTCLFKREGNYVTVWIDRASFEQPDLQIFNNEHNLSFDWD